MKEVILMVLQYLLQNLLQCFIVVIVVLFLFIPPLSIQYLLYLPAKRILKKIPTHVVYGACFLLNTIILVTLYYFLFGDVPDEADEHPLDIIEMAIFDFILKCTWLLCYIGVLISCVIRIVKSKRKENSSNQ